MEMVRTRVWVIPVEQELMAIDIREVATLSGTEAGQLADLLRAVVAQGASVGYLAPPPVEDAVAYWQGVVRPGNILLVAEVDGQVVGTVQLELAGKANGRHRAEVNRLLVHPAWQRRGIGRALMTELERVAGREGRTLLHLDTREGDGSVDAYRRLGWVEAGTIPQWARSTDGTLAGTVFFYRLLDAGS